MTDPRPRFFRSLVVVFLGLGLLAALIGRSGLVGSASPRGTATTNGAPTPIAALSVPTSTPTPEPTPTVTPTATATSVPKPVKVGDTGPPQIGAVAAILVDERSGAVLYAKNEHLKRAPASITKIITAIVALERARPDDLVDASYDATELVDSTLMGLYPSDEITLRDLLYGLMLPSGNDAALAIANHVAGSQRAFANLMNARMADLQLEDSHFVNAHGLDASGHYTSAYDMAMIARYAMRNADFRQLAAARAYTVNLVRQRKAISYEIYNLNRLVTSYPGGDGVKLGYTEDAGHTIVGSATRDGHRVYAAVLGSDNLWLDTPPLLNYAFNNFRWTD